MKLAPHANKVDDEMNWEKNIKILENMALAEFILRKHLSIKEPITIAAVVQKHVIYSALKLFERTESCAQTMNSMFKSWN